MSEEIDYNSYMRRAMRHMISDVLTDVADNGLPGEHHFFISFLTQVPGVSIPAHLLANYPEEMTIVLQDWFQDLAVMEDDRFAVTLSFHGKAEQLVVPFVALTGFSDPSVQFSMRFDAQDLEEDQIRSAENSEELLEASTTPTKNKSVSGDADVIQLDAFRKK